MNPSASSNPATGKSAFARTDLVALLALLALVILLAVPMTASGVSGNHRITCLSNLKRLGQAFLLYAADNQGYAPHPTWGADLTGPSGWAYATRSDGRFSSARPAPQSQAGRTFSVAREAQLPFLKMGQVWPYVLDEDAYLCPEDFAGWDSYPTRRMWIARPWKLSSFNANGATIGYGSHPGPAGSTVRLSWFRPDDALLWEQSATDGFFFNDAGTFGGESMTSLHDGGGHVAAADGRVDWLDYKAYRQLAGERTRNRIWCYPLTRSGGSQ
ncbi:MAG: hypothetical protein JNL10_17150 [Verrucomicrobiales bacterium]|nr:hypothetical protein [Verrucomicrobiales bacterium]